MVIRNFWLQKIKDALCRRSVLWLSGVRRVGKTYLCKSLPDIEYFDCELPSTRRLLEAPQSFLSQYKGKTIVLDEVHRLNNPSELLKISADYFPETRVIATGSSTLGASSKFRDTLTGRKMELWLTPMMSEDLFAFDILNMEHRFIRGGLPPFFLSKELPEIDFQEWMDAFWAKDIMELFRLQQRHSFLRFTELLLAQSGGIFEASKFARPCEVSRVTISNYLAVLEATLIVHVIRPFSTYRPSEIVSAPKVYGFDTGFVFFYKNYKELRKEDYGILWEHYVLNEIFAHLQNRKVFYWRDKRGHEVDFILARDNAQPLAIECKYSASEVDLKNIKSFRRQYPDGLNYVVCADIDREFVRTIDNLQIHFTNLQTLINILNSSGFNNQLVLY